MEQIIEKEDIWRQFNTLPDEAKREVIDFMAFLQTRYPRPNIKKHSKKLKLSEEPFIGIWEDREDLNNSVAWVRNVRKHEWVG
jgi:uncharacterized protein YfbU (UPF0304 family)